MGQLSSWLNLSRASTGVDVRAVSISFRAPLEHDRKALEDFFGCPVQRTT
ncbi:hypothetical protein [Enhygromyxa salina]|uniref:Uncharacterized protein n=1 Tax=Enhygromyxa salina TaxID=215803 RepID=A0A2S9YST2_9BACT|nr:hypothetical protein [Enhygromyxa salina]PRQ08099.1 hypothetical protein ENSA7_20710 [Enhygromyxa salina]